MSCGTRRGTLSARFTEKTSGFSTKASFRPGPPEIPVETDADRSPRSKPVGKPIAEPIARHFLAWLFDDVHLSFSDLVQTRAAIYTTSGHVTLDFTDDRDKLAQAVNQIRPFPTFDGGQLDCPEISYYEADRILNRNDEEARLAAVVSYVIKCAPPGPSKSDVDAAIAEGYQAVKALAPRALSLGKQATEANLSVLKDLIRRMAAMPGSHTIVLVSPGFFLADENHDGETDVTDRAIRANVVISSLGTQGVFAMTPGGAAETPPGLPIDVKQEFDRKASYADEGIMENLADATGGTFFHNDNGYFAGFKRLAAQPEYIYVLGFSPQNLKLDGSFHALKVTLRNGAGLQLQARRGYFVGRHEDAAEREKDEVREAFFSRDEIRGLPVELLTEVVKTGDNIADLSIAARVDLKRLHFRKTDGRNNDTLTVLAGVFDRNGNYVTGNRKTIDLKLKDQTLEQFPQERITVKTSLDVASGSYVVRLVVRDSEGRIMSAQNSAVMIP